MRSLETVEPDGRYSWIVAVAGSIAMVFNIGTLYSYGVFLGLLSEPFGISRLALSTVFSGAFVAFYLAAGVIGIYATRLPLRGVLLAAGALTAALAPSLYVVDAYVGLIVVFGLLGTALGVVYVVLVAVVPQWFQQRQGIATGVLIVGTGLSLFLLPPLWRFALTHWSIPRGFFIILVISSASFLLAGAVCRRPPWTERSSPSVGELYSWVVRILRIRAAQLVFLSVGLAFTWYYLLAAYAIDLFAARGVSESTATLLFGLIGGVSIVTRVGSGILADRTGYDSVYVASLGCATVASTFLLVPHVAATMLSVLLFGIALGGISTLYIPVLLRAFGTANDTAVMGLANVVFGVFALGAPPLGTALVAYQGSYLGVITVTMLSTIGAIAAALASEQSAIEV